MINKVKIFLAVILMAGSVFAQGMNDWTQGPQTPHVFSMSCKVTAVNGDLATPEGRAKAVEWWKRNGFTKLWIESYRHGEYVSTERLIEVRHAFRSAGFVVCGMITPTMLNDPAPGKKEQQMVVCWSDPKAKLFLTTSTPLKDPNLTAKAKELNVIVWKTAEAEKLPVIDLFSLMDPLDRNEYWSDTYHYRAPGIEMEAEKIVEEVTAGN